MSIMNNITQISKSDFIENKAYGSGGAICINGYTWNDDGSVDVKEHIGAKLKTIRSFWPIALKKARAELSMWHLTNMPIGLRILRLIKI